MLQLGGLMGIAQSIGELQYKTERRKQMKEQEIVARIQKYLKANGAYVVKTIVSNRAGIPDILACLDGTFIGIEVKTDTGVVSPLQSANLVMIVEAGGVGMVARSTADVKRVLEEARLV